MDFFAFTPESARFCTRRLGRGWSRRKIALEPPFGNELRLGLV